MLQQCHLSSAPPVRKRPLTRLAREPTSPRKRGEVRHSAAARFDSRSLRPPGQDTSFFALAAAMIGDRMRAVQNRERSEFDLLAIVCILPSLLYVLCMFVYPFLYGLYLSLRPQKIAGFSLANYFAFFSDPYQFGTIWITFSLAIPNTVVVLLLSLLLAYGMRRGFRMERTITTVLILPISLGVILLSEGILGFYGSQGWFNQAIIALGLVSEPFILTHNYIGVVLALFMQQFPFCFLMLLGYISGIDQSLDGAARML